MSLHLIVPLVEVRVVMQCGLELSTRFTGSGASWEVPGQPPPVPCPGPPGMSYRVI